MERVRNSVRVMQLVLCELENREGYSLLITAENVEGWGRLVPWLNVDYDFASAQTAYASGPFPITSLCLLASELRVQIMFRLLVNRRWQIVHQLLPARPADIVILGVDTHAYAH